MGFVVAILIAFALCGPASAQVGDATIRGRLIDENGKPIAKATILVRTPQDIGTTTEANLAVRVMTPEAPLRTEKSDSDGQFIVRKLEFGRYLLDVLADGFRPVRISDVVARSGENEELSFRLRTAEPLKRWILRPDGRPFAGQKVYWIHYSSNRSILDDERNPLTTIAKTADDGSFAVFGSEDFFEVGGVVFSPASGIAVHQQIIRFQPGGSGGPEILYDDSAAIVGTVVDGAGDPMPGADVEISVYWEGADVLGRTKTGADGRYRFDGLPCAHIVSLTALTSELAGYFVPSEAQSPGTKPARPSLLLAGEQTIDLTMLPATTAKGAIRFSPDGSPVAGTTVSLFRKIGDSEIRVNDVATAGDGTFAFPHLPPYESFVAFVMDRVLELVSVGPKGVADDAGVKGYPGFRFRTDAVAADQMIDVKVRSGPMINGVVVDEDNRPVAFARVVVTRAQKGKGENDELLALLELMNDFGVGRCDKEGKFSIRCRNLAEEYGLITTAHGFTRNRGPTYRRDASTPIKITLKRSSEPVDTLPRSGRELTVSGDFRFDDNHLSISGRVVSDGQGAADCWVQITDAGTNRPITKAKTGAGGWFRATELKEGRYALILAPGTEFKIGDKVLRSRGVRSAPVEAGTHGHQIVIASGLSIRGQAISDKNEPLDGMTIDAFKVSGPGSSVAAATAKIEKGSFSLEGLDDGKYRFEIRGLFGKIAATADAGAENVKVVLPKPGKIRGRVLWSDKTPAKEVLVWPRGVEGSVKTDADGKFEMPAVLPGRYKIIASIKINGVDRFGETPKLDLAPGGVLDTGDIILEGSKR